MTEDEAHDFALLTKELLDTIVRLEVMTINRDDWRRTAEMVAEEVDGLEARLAGENS